WRPAASRGSRAARPGPGRARETKRKEKAKARISRGSPPVFLLLELAPEYLAGRRFRQRLDELHQARCLEGRHLVARPGDDRVGLDLAARGGLEHDNRFHRLAAVRVACGDNAGLLDVRMRVEHRLD